MPKFTERIIENIKERISFARTHIKRENIFHHTALFLILVVSFLTRFFPYFKYEVALKAYDPHSQLRSASLLLDLGLRDYWNFFDPTCWYPWGMYYGQRRFIGTPMSSVIIYKIAHTLGLNWSIEFCAYMQPVILGCLTVLGMYLLGRQLGNSRVGLIAAFFLATLPAHTQRSMAGFYDNEAVGIFFLVFALYFFTRSLKKGSITWGIAAGIALGFLCDSWGGSNYPLGLLAIFVLTLTVINKASDRLFIAYSSTIIVAAFIRVLDPRNGVKGLLETEILPAYFALVFLTVFLIIRELRPLLSRTAFQRILYMGYTGCGLIIVGMAVAYVMGFTKLLAAKFFSVMLPFFRSDVPILKSVSEHLTLSWGNLFMNIYIIAFLLPVGIYYAYQSPTENNIFMILFTLTSLYFAGSMVRLVLILAPAAALIGAKAVDETLIPFALTFQDKFTLSKRKKRLVTGIGNEHVTAAYALMFIVLFISLFHGLQLAGGRLAPAEILVAFEQPNGEVTVWGDWQEALMWLKINSDTSTVVASWWDYGYWITTNTNVTSLCDNATSNSTQIGNVGTLLMSDPARALEICKLYDVQYILVNVAAGYVQAGSDIGKAIWMIRIADKDSQFDDIKVDDYYKGGKYIGKNQGGRFDESLLWYCITGPSVVQSQLQQQANQQLMKYELVSDLSAASTAPEGFVEAYTTSHFWVRIWEVAG